MSHDPYDALNELEYAMHALEGIELLALAGNDGNGDLHVVKTDAFVALMYLVRTTLDARVADLRAALTQEKQHKPRLV